MNKLIFFPGRPKYNTIDKNAPRLNVRYIPTHLILPAPFQPRKNYDGESIIRLADSMRRYGVIEPIGVRRCTAGKFEVVFGERRMRAAQLIDLDSIPCIILENISRRTSLELAYAENTLREPLNIVEKAQGAETLMRRFDMSRDNVCENLSVYRNEMSFMLEVLRLSAEEKELICRSFLTREQIEPLLKIENSHVRRHLMMLIADKGVPASGCAAFVSEFLRCPEKKKEESVKKTKPRPVRKFILGDIRVFMNSIDHAVELVRKSGLDVHCEKQMKDESLSYTINVIQKRTK